MQLKKTFFAVFALVMVFSVFNQVGAAEFISPKDKETGRVVMSAGSEHKNVYTAGADVTVNSQIFGDLFAAGSEVSLDGVVEQDAGVAAGTVSMQGPVGGDARLMGGSVTVNNSVAGDLLVAAGKFSLTEKAQVNGDLIFAASQASVDGRVDGKLLATGGNIYVNSVVVGEVKIWKADKVTFGPKAEVLGKVVVSAKSDPVIEEGAKVSDIEFTLKSSMGGEREGFFAKIAAAGLVISFLGYIFILLLVAWVAPKKAENFVASMKAKFWSNLGFGLAGLVVVPILSVIAMIILVGVYAGLIALVAYAFMLAIAWIMGLIYMGSFSYMLIKRTKTMEVTWQTAVLGSIVSLVLKFIPVVGWLVACGIMLAAFGNLLIYVKRNLIERGSRTSDIA